MFDAVPQADIEAAMDKVEALIRPDDSCHYEELRRRWRPSQRIFAELSHISFEASPAAEPVGRAIGYLRALEGWSDAAMRDTPMGAVSRHASSSAVTGKRSSSPASIACPSLKA